MSDFPSLTAEQLDVLRTQIMAFRLLSSNVPLPSSVQNKLIYNNFIASHFKESIKDIPTVDNENTVPSGSSIALKLLYGALHGPKLGSVRISHHNNHFPMVVPEPLNSIALLRERDKMIATRMKHRLEQLENLPEPHMDDQKLDAVIEYKGLKVMEQQKKLRLQAIGIWKKFVEAGPESKLGKKSGLRSSRFTERQEKPKQPKPRNVGFLSNVMDRVREFQNTHRNRQQQLARIGKALNTVHLNYEREEMKRRDRLAKERINALKADDEEAYLKLLDQQKDTRLTHLLRQTDIYLETLSHSVLAHKHGNKEYSVLSDSGEKLDYYTIAHTYTEQIVEQPNILTGGKLKDYQIKGLQWMVSLYNNKLNGILADEMGLGKTIQTIALISYLLEKKGQPGPYLIIVPLSTLTNWSLEFEKWAPSILRVEYKGGPATRKAIQKNVKHGRFNVMLTTYEYVIKDKAFLGKIKWLYIIVDEGHRMKNVNSKLTVILSTYYAAMYRMILTGTPLQNNLPELWALLNFILPKIFDSKQGFDEWFNAPLANTGEKLELNEEEVLLVIRGLHKVLRPFLLRRLKKDVECELPDKIEKVIKCPMSALQHKLYEIVRERNLVGIEGGRHMGIKKFNNTLMQLRKICNHPFVFEEVEKQLNPGKINNDLLYRVSGKFELLGRILPKLKATGHRVLMFFQMTMVMTVMEDFLTMEGHQYMRLDGSTKAEDRSEMLRVFNAEDSPYFIFLLSTRAGGLGLNLQSADTVIIFDSDWNPHQDLQAQDRAHRIGQTREVRIFRLVTVGSIEELILARAQYKLSLDGKIIQAGKFDHKSTNEEREAMLRSLLDMEVQSRQTESEENQEVFDDDELNELLARTEEELEVFRKIDKERRSKKQKSRLITEEELPEVYMEKTSESVQKEDESEPAGRKRSRTRIVYDEESDDY